MSSGASPVVLKEGFLSKRSRNAWPVARFQRRYFRLYPGELQYFYTPQETVPRRRVRLHLDTRVTPTNDQGYERCFVVKPSPTENFYVQAENEDEKFHWVTAIYDALRRTDDVAREQEDEVPLMPSMSMLPPPPPTPQQQRILLNLTVVEATGLKGVNYVANAKSDPYCVVNFIGKDGAMIRSEEVKTRYVTDTVDPVWNQNFQLGHAVDLSIVESILFELFDHEMMGSPKPLGFVKVPLSTFHMSPASTRESELVDRSFRVHPPAERPSMMTLVTGGSSSPRNEKKEQEAILRDHGKLHLMMSIVGPNLVNFFRSLRHTIAPSNQVVTDSVDHSDNRLEVSVLCARDLIAADFNKSSDPFVELTLLDDKSKPIRGEFYRTSVKQKTRNPAWQDEHYVFGRISRIEEATYLRARVMDWDEHSKNDPLGYIVISLATLSAHSQTEWYALLPEDTMAVRENLGCIQLKIMLAGETRGERERRIQIEREVALKTHEVSVEQLELENAQQQLHEAACSLDGARIACAVHDYQAREPQFYGLNGCIHYLNTQLPRAHRETTSTDEGFQSRAGIEGQALLEVSVIGTRDLKKPSTTVTAPSPYALIEIEPSVCIEECRRISAPQSPQKSKRVEASVAATEARSGIFARRTQAEVSSHRAKLAKNEMRSERHLEIAPDEPMLKVEVKSGHGLIGVDFGGYSDPYCTLTLTDRVTGKPIESEKKRTAVISKTLNPVWENEVFVMGHNFPLEKAGTLLIHVKDHNMTRSTPLGRIQIPLSDLCHASATTTSISSTAKEKRYTLMPEPWMKKHAQNLGELCIKTEVIGDATVLAEMMQRSIAEGSPTKILSFLSMQSFSSEAHLSDGMSSMSLTGQIGDEDETTEIIEKGKPIRTATASGTSATWRKEKFELSLSYPGIFSGNTDNWSRGYVLRLRVHGARNLLGLNDQARQLQDKKRDRRNHLLGYREKTSAYFTVIPVQRNGRLEHSEKKQGLTVYGTRNPNWPEREIVFTSSNSLDSKQKDLQSISHLSLHVYSRDLETEVTRPIAELLDADERDRKACLKRYQIRKIGSTGLVEDDGFEVLPFGQRVLAYRKCGDAGRFFPATVQHYYPFDFGSYDVLFEDDVETIDDLWDMFSLDYKGRIELIHADGTVDVSFETKEGDKTKTDYARNVSPSLLKPVDSFTSQIESVMARQMDATTERENSRLKLVHHLSDLAVEVLSATGLPRHVISPRCEITLIGSVSSQSEHITASETGQLKLKNGVAVGVLTQDEGQVLSFKLNSKTEPKAASDQTRFEDNVLALRTAADGLEKEVLSHTSSLLIEIIDGDTLSANMKPKASTSRVVVAFARVDLVTLTEGTKALSVKLLPPGSVDYYKYVGSLDLKVQCVKQTTPDNQDAVTPTGAGQIKIVRGASTWMENRTADETVSSPRSGTVSKLTRIARRQQLRSTLTPTENAQIDAFHTVLVLVMKRIISILREIQLFDDFEALEAEDFPKFHHLHTVNSNTDSEWIGRPINEIPLEVRKTIVENLEFELLEIAGSDEARGQSSSSLTTREQWIKIRTERQLKLQKVAGCFMQDRTSVGMLSVPCCFTGEGMVNWIKGCSRKVPVLWDDKWTALCQDKTTQDTCKLEWKKATSDLDALVAPESEAQALLWLNALGDAGYIENVTPTLSISNTNKKYFLVENKSDRFYRLREVERWVRKETRDKSLFPLDLVPELDCCAQVDLVPRKLPPSSPAASPKKGKKAAPILQEPVPAVDANTEKSDVIIAQRRMYSKKLVDHVEGSLGLQNIFSSMLFSQDVLDNSLLKPVAAKTQQIFGESLLWDWKYCLFVHSDKMLYVYESESSRAPTIILDMNSSACHAAYNFAYETSGGWFNVVGATVLQASVTADGSTKYLAIGDTVRDKLMNVTKDGNLVFEFKTSNAQVWVQSFVRANIRVDMKPNQPVVLKRLNPSVVQTKCTHQVANYNPNDLNGSFLGMLNKFFRHCDASSATDSEKKMRDLRARVRNELKKPSVVGDAVMAYFGSSKKFNPGPTNPGAFTQGGLYSARIARIRAPFVASKDSTMQTYAIDDAPPAMKDLLKRYGVSDKQSWLKVAKPKRDIFLLYDVEYQHDHEIIREEDLLREHLRTNGGDLDPFKVEERCTDLNIWFKPSDLEDCVTRIVLHMTVKKPLGYVKIPVRNMSVHRAIDMWYPLAPEHDMVQKEKLGQIRVHLRLTPTSETLRSKKTSTNLLKEVREAAATAAAAKPLAVMAAAANSGFRAIEKAVKRVPGSPTAVGASTLSQERSFVIIRILEGRKLICADKGTNTSDPYVKIVLIRERDDKEQSTNLKTDIKFKTLSPKWTNQEFVLGKSTETVLSDKKAILLRIMDKDRTADDQMGCLKIEFQRDESKNISGLVLVHADENGRQTSQVLQLNDKKHVEVDEKVLADASMGKNSLASGNDPVTDGRLGKLRFVIELSQNENFVDPTDVSATQLASLVRSLETKFSCEVKFESIDALSKELSESLCVFTPIGEGGQRINYDVHTEDLGKSNKLQLGDLMRLPKEKLKILGRTFDASKMTHFDVELHNPKSGKTFSGRCVEKFSWLDPRHYNSWRQVHVTLSDKDNKKVEVKLTLLVRVIAIHRAERLQRLLAETFRMVGLDFDVRRINEGSDRTSGSAVKDFLWGVCKAHFLPDQINTTKELMAQVHRMCQSTKLHWKFTPQLLGLVLEHVFLFGEKDRLSFDDAFALDEILSRWSLVLQHLNDAKTQLVGHLHGRETPRLVHTLMSECDWTGFEVANLPDRSSTSSTPGSTGGSELSHGSSEEIVLSEGSKVHAMLPARKHAGVPVDVKLTGEPRYVAGTILAQHGDDIFDVAFCASAHVSKNVDLAAVRDEELPPLRIDQTVFVCPAVNDNATKSRDAGQRTTHSKAGKSGKIIDIDESKAPKPIQVAFDGEDKSTADWFDRASLDVKIHRVCGDALFSQFVPDDYVRVFKDHERKGRGTLARVVKNHASAKYDVQYVEIFDHSIADGEKSIADNGEEAVGSDKVNVTTIKPVIGDKVADETSVTPGYVIEANVPRTRLEKDTHEKEIYEATIVRTKFLPLSASDSTVQNTIVSYDLLLENGDYVHGVSRDQLRPHHEVFPSDKCVLASMFTEVLELQDGTESNSDEVKKLRELYAHDQIVKVYVMLPAKPKDIFLRDRCTMKLLQTLSKRDASKPRFVEQCHGYSTSFSDVEKNKLDGIYTASGVIRGETARRLDSFNIEKCVCLYMAPQPRVEIHGVLRITHDDSKPSRILFNLLKEIATKKECQDQGRLFTLFQMLIRNAATVHMPLDRRGRMVRVKKVKLTSDKQMDIVFEIEVVPNNAGSLAHEVGIAASDGDRIFKCIKNLTRLVGIGEHPTSIDDVDWALEAVEPSGMTTPMLKIEVLDKEGRSDSEPSLSLEMLPLDDQRLSVHDIDGKVWEICLPMDTILVEAQLRRHLVPFHKATIAAHPKPLEASESRTMLAQVNKRSRRDSLLHNKPTDHLKVKRRTSAGRQLNVQFVQSDKESGVVSEHDIKFDSLRIVLKQVSDLALDEAVGQKDLEVLVSLVSSDFRPMADADLETTTPFGVILTGSGEIKKGSEVRPLQKGRMSTDWITDDTAKLMDEKAKTMDNKAKATNEKAKAMNDKAKAIDDQARDDKANAKDDKSKATDDNANAMMFGSPTFDLARVSHVRVRVRTKETHVLVGSCDIPISKIPVTKSNRDSTAVESNVKRSGWELLTGKEGSRKASPLSSDLSCEQTLPLCKMINNQEDTVGKITLHVERVQSAGVGDVVLARRFLSEADFWAISPDELLSLTLKQHEDHLMRGLLATSSIVSHGGLQLLTDPTQQELQLQKIADVMLISDAMERIYATKPDGGKKSAAQDGSTALSSPRFSDQMNHVLKQTKWFIEDTAAELGIRTSRKRLPWSAEVVEDERKLEKRDFVVMRANASNTSTRVRRTLLKLYQTYRGTLIPTLKKLYEADAMGDHIDVHNGEVLLKFFEQEVEDLEAEDQHVFRRVYQRIRLIKVAKVLQDIMHARLIVTVMNYDHAMGDDEIGTAYIPLIDLLDRVEHDNGYELKKKKRSNRSGRPGSPHSNFQFSSSPSQGKVHLKIKLTYSESSLLEQATRIYKIIKDKYVAQHELSRRRVNAAVVPAQRRRWVTIKGFLDELKAQSCSKLHWQRTPVLLSLVWDIFVTRDHVRQKEVDDEEQTHLEGLIEKANDYRSAVVDVHRRWANLQPLLEELLQVQAASQIHAQRAPELLDLIDGEVDGLDLVLMTAYQQVSDKWYDLKDALEELVLMKQRKKIHMGRAPQLLTKVTQRCSKGLNERYADAVSDVQFRWMAITKHGGPLNELRLTEKKGLHWRRTHELVLLLNEQCEGFAEVDATTLTIVQKRWDQVQEWLDDVVRMQVQHTIDCESTPFMLKRMHLIESRNQAAGTAAKHAVSLKKRMQAPASSPRARSPSRSSNRRESDPPSPRSIPTTSFAQGGAQDVDAEAEVDRLEGLAEWYSIEESKRELERIPYHRITTDYDRNNRLKYSQDGKDTRLFITQEEMAFTPQNVRAALVDRGVIPQMASTDDPATKPTAIATPTKAGATTTIPKDLLDEIHHLEKSIESMYNENGSLSDRYVKWNSERVAELYLVIESLGKSDLLWKIDHAVNTNHEIEVPSNVTKLLTEMRLRAIPTTEIDDLIRTLLVMLQKEELKNKGVSVPPTANFTTVLTLMQRHRVKDVALPSEITEIQTLLQAHGMDKKGDPVLLRGMRIGTQVWSPDDSVTDGAQASSQGKTSNTKINIGLGIVDSKIEQLRKTLLMEALRKRNSLVKTFPVESNILTDEELAECTEVDMSGDYMTLIERFQQLLIHESYTKRLAEYAAMDRCMRALLNVPADTIVTKEDIATKLQTLGNSRFRLPLEAFTSDELLEAANKGKIRKPTEEMLARCPTGRNAKAMAYYAAMSHAALVFQETVRFRARLDPIHHRFVDTFPFERVSSVDGLSVPKNRNRMNLKEYVVDWLMGSDESVVKIQRHLGAYHRQRLEWASAAFTLRNRWFMRGFGWCDDATRCAGVKVLLQKLLLFETANKMHMMDTESLLSEVNEKCENLREREGKAKQELEGRYIANLQRLEKLVIHAEKCMNNRKIHAEEAPALLHAIEQACVVPNGLHALHKQAYHVVSTHWMRHRARLSELVHMQKQGTFSIERTPELLSAMEFHTEGIAGADELTMDKVMENVNASTTPADLQQRYVDKKVDEIRRGQRKQSSSLRLNLDDANTEKDVVLEDLKEEDGGNNSQWQSLSPSKRDLRPLSPREKQTSWKVVTPSTNSGDAALSPAKPSIVIEDKPVAFEKRRKSSIGEDLRELLKSPSKWLIGTTEPQDSIRPEVFFPREVTLDLGHSHAHLSATAATTETPHTVPAAPASAE